MKPTFPSETPRTPSPLPHTVSSSLQSPEKKSSAFHTSEYSPRTPQSVNSSLELDDTPITPPNFYEELGSRNATGRLAEASWKGQQLQDSVNDQSQDTSGARVLLFQSLNPFAELRLGKSIGQGQWSRVCEAWESPLATSSDKGRLYAAKVASSKASGVVLRQEARILTHISSMRRYSRHVVRFYGFDLQHQALVLEYLGPSSGLALNDAIKAGICKPITIARDLIHGLAFIHGAQVIHGDIKPDNLVVRRSHRSQHFHNSLNATVQPTFGGSTEYEAVYIDFSAAHFNSPDSQPTESAGTYDFMAPELFSTTPQSSISTTASDVYGLGVTLMTVSTDRSPYDSAPNLLSRRAMAMQGTPAYFLAQHVNAWQKLEASKLRSLLEPAIAKDPEHRCNTELWKDVVDREFNTAASQE